MQWKRGIAFVLLGNCLACGGVTGTVNSSGGTSLTYSQTVSAYNTEGLDTFTKGKAVADSYSTFTALNLESGGTTDPDTIDTDMTAFTAALANYVTHLDTVGGYAATTFPTKSDANVAAPFKDVGTLGIDAGQSLSDLNTTLQTKKVECDALKARISTNLNDLTAFAAAKQAYETCAHDLAILAASEGFKVVAVSTGGSVTGGAAAGGVFIYVVGGGAAALLTGPGILVVAIGGVVGGKVATAIYDYCTSSSDKNIAAKGVSSGNYCAASSVKGTTGSSMAMNTSGGTGSLQIFVEGYAPVLIQNVTITAGQTLTVTINPVALTSVTDNSTTDLTTATDNNTATTGVSTGSSCSEVVGIGDVNVPADPGPGETVTVTATLVPAVSGCTVSYSVAGTDGYAASGSPTSDSAGQITFTIPGGAADVRDAVQTTESVTGVQSSLTYTF